MKWEWFLLFGIVMLGCTNSTISPPIQPTENSRLSPDQTCPKTCLSSQDSSQTCWQLPDHCFAQAAVCCQKFVEEDMHSQRYSQALKRVREAIFKAQAHQQENWLFRWEWELGRIFKQLHQLDDAINAYQRALAILFPATCASSGDLKSLGMVKGFNWKLNGPNTYEHIHRFLEENIDLLLQKASSTANGQHKEDALLQVQKGIEVLKRADLENYFEGECIQKRDDSSANVELGAETAVIYPILLPERLELLVLLPGEKLFLLPAQFLPRDRIETVIESIRQNWQTDPSNLDPEMQHSYLRHAQQLYQWLIVPLKTVLPSSVKILVFVSSGELLTVNPSAFHDGQRFLLQQYAVVIIPGLSLLNVAQSSQFIRKERILMAMTKPVDDYPELYFGKKEFEVIKREYKPRIRLLDQEFTTANWQRLHKDFIAEEVEVMHIISHAHFAKEMKNKDNFIKTFDGQLSFEEFKDLFGKLKFPINLLLLSACSTAEGDEAQWASLGLSGLAIKTGVQSSLATLWKAHDVTTYFLVTDFYQHWLEVGKSKAMALQSAQQKLINSTYNHPFYWAHMVLVGDWQ